MTSSDAEPVVAPKTRVALDGATAGHLRIRRGLEAAKLTADPRLGDLLQGSWRWPPKVDVDGGDVTLTYPRFRLARRVGTDEIAINAAIPWDITVEGSIRRLSADLRALKLRSLRIDGGATGVALVLGKPAGEVPIEVRSADRLTIRRPAYTEVRVTITKGASQVAVDDQTYGAIAGETVLSTGPIVRNAYLITVTAARRLRITTT